VSTQQYLIDASTRHQVFLQRYGGGESKKALTYLNNLRRKINARLSQEPTNFQRNRLSALLDDINKITNTLMTDMGASIKHGARKLATAEAAFSTTLYNKASTTDFILPSDEQLITAVNAAPMAAPAGMKTITIEDALREFGKKKAAQIAQTISDGVTLGQTTPEISRNVGTMINTLQRRQLDALVRTVTNHTSSVSRSMVYDANSDLLEGYQWVATLDGRTTMICGSRDGKVFQKGGPMPPAHWNCRSTTIPKVKDEFNIGSKLKGARPSIGADGAKTVSGRITYGGWLKKQPVEFVDEALGVERSILFRSGKLSIDKFTDPTGRVYNLQQLQDMNPFAFQEF